LLGEGTHKECPYIPVLLPLSFADKQRRGGRGVRFHAT
jgi:hypothetical protein